MPLALEMRDFLGGAYSNLFVGLNDAVIPFAGSNVLVDLSSPFVLVPLTLPGQGPGEGDLTIPFILPDDPTFLGLTLKYHMLAVDPGAPHGVSFSNGLSETIGS